MLPEMIVMEITAKTLAESWIITNQMLLVGPLVALKTFKVYITISNLFALLLAQFHFPLPHLQAPPQLHPQIPLQPPKQLQPHIYDLVKFYKIYHSLYISTLYTGCFAFGRLLGVGGR